MKFSAQRLSAVWGQMKAHGVLPHLALWLVIAVLLVGFRVHTSGLIEQDRVNTITATESELINLGRLSQEHAERTFDSADQLLRSIRFHYLEHPGKIDLKLLHGDETLDPKLFPQLAIIDARGILKYSTVAFDGPIDLSDREHFKIHVTSGNDELYISQPVLGRATGIWTIQFSRRITGRAGKFEGVVVVSLDPSYFSGFYNDLQLGSHGVAALYRSDGWLFARKSSQAIGIDVDNTASGPILNRVAQGDTSGIVTSRSLVDGIERTYYFRKLPKFPALVTVGMGVEDILAHHEQTRSDYVREGFTLGLFLIAAGSLGSMYLSVRHSIQAAKAQSEARYRTLMDWTPQAVTVHRDGVLQYVNPAAVHLFGARSEQELIGKSVLDFVHPDCHPIVGEPSKLPGESDRNSPQPLKGHTLLRANGSAIEVEVHDTSVDFDGSPAILTAISDVTERNRVDSALQLSASVFTHAREGICIVDSKGAIVNVNEAFCRMTGYARDQVLGQNPRILQSGRHGKDFYAAMWSVLHEVDHWNGELWDRRADGTEYPASLSISVVRDGQGRVSQYVGMFTDIAERKKLEEQVKQLAFSDPLTQLPNRRLLEDRMTQAIAASRRSSLYNALLFLDLDNFKPLNDTHGHRVGDLLLVEVANRLRACVREVDTVARLGGDEFVVLLSGLDLNKEESATQACAVAEKIRASLSASYLLSVDADDSPHEVVEHRCSASIGVVVFADSEGNSEMVLRWADAAMYRAKRAGHNSIRFHEAAAG